MISTTGERCVSYGSCMRVHDPFEPDPSENWSNPRNICLIYTKINKNISHLLFYFAITLFNQPIKITSDEARTNFKQGQFKNNNKYINK
jgi:hypothetical protein